MCNISQVIFASEIMAGKNNNNKLLLSIETEPA